MWDVSEFKDKPYNELTDEQRKKLKGNETEGCLKFFGIILLIVVLILIVLSYVS